VSAPRHAKPEAIARVPASGPVRALLEASAGTGKTHSIMGLVADLVIEREHDLDRILLVTFTEKAAGELRVRLRRRLEALLAPPEAPPPAGAPAWEVTPPVRARLERALRTPPHVATIHAFAKGALGRHAFRTGRPFREVLVDRRSAVGEAFWAHVRRDLARAGREADLRRWLESGRDLDRLERLLARCLNEPRTTVIEPAVDHAEVQARLEAAAEALADPERRRALRCAVRREVRHGGRKKAVLKRVDELLPEQLAEAAADPSRLAAHQDLPGVLDWLLERIEPLAFTGEADAVRRLLRELRRVLVDFDAAAVQLWLPGVQERLADQKRRRGEHDFADLLTLLDDALAGPEGAALRAALRRDYDAVLIDEHQDTSGLMWGYRDPLTGEERGIFRPLFHPPEAAQVLAAVGDPKQSIYGWNGADVRVYGRFRREVMAAADGTVVHLEESWRATPDLVAAQNRVLDQAAPRPFFPGDSDVRYEHPVRCPAAHADWRLVDGAGDAVAPLHVVEVAPPDGGGSLRAPALRRALGRAIARDVRRALDPDRGLRLVAGGEARPLVGRDVFVLTRTNGEARELAETLRAEGVPCCVHKQAGLFQTPEATDVATLLRALLEPTRTRPRLAAFHTPFFGVPLTALPRWRDLADDHPHARRLADWAALAARDVRRLLTVLLEDAGLVRRERLLGADPWARVAVYGQLLEALHERACRAGGDLAELLAWLDALRRGDRKPEDEEGDLIREDGGRDEVVLLTCHKAKGLEAALVYLYGGFSGPKREDLVNVYYADAGAVTGDGGDGTDDEAEPRGDDPEAEVGFAHSYDEAGRRVLHVGPLDADAARRVVRDRDEEERRVLYVALTRAEARVVAWTVPCADPDADDPGWAYPYHRGAGYEPLNRRLRALLAERAGDPELARLLTVEQVAPEEPSAAPPPVDPGALAAWSPPAALLAPDDRAAGYAALRAARRARVVTSYSRLKREAAAGEAAGPADAPAPAAAPIELGPTDLPGGARHGSFLHELIERLDLGVLAGTADADAWAALPEVDALLTTTAARFGVDPVYLPYCARLLHGALRLPIDRGGLVLPEGLAAVRRETREVEFRFPLPGGDRVGGVVDYAFEDAAGKLWFLDWKSDLLPGYDEARLRSRVVQDYDTQRLIYGLALKRVARADGPAAAAERVGGMVYAFLRGMTGAPSAGVLVDPLDWATLEADEARLRALMGVA